MKRYGNLYPQVIEFENILLASRQAQKSKRFQDNVLGRYQILAIEEYLVKLKLKIHPIKSQLFETKIGASFLGFRIFPET